MKKTKITTFGTKKYNRYITIKIFNLVSHTNFHPFFVWINLKVQYNENYKTHFKKKEESKSSKEEFLLLGEDNDDLIKNRNWRLDV